MNEPQSGLLNIQKQLLVFRGKPKVASENWKSLLDASVSHFGVCRGQPKRPLEPNQVLGSTAEGPSIFEDRQFFYRKVVFQVHSPQIVLRFKSQEQLPELYPETPNAIDKIMA